MVVVLLLLLLLDLRRLPVTLGFACMVLLLIAIEAQHLARREDGGKGGAKAALVAVRDAYVSIHNSVDECVFPSEVIGGSEWRPPTRLLGPGRPDRDAHRLVDALAGDSAGRGGMHEVDMEPGLGLGLGQRRSNSSSRRGHRARVACLCRRHRADWEIDGADECEVLVHARDHITCLVGCVGVVERGEGRYRIDGYDDKNAGFERSSVESFVVVQPMGHRAPGRGYERRARWREGEMERWREMWKGGKVGGGEMRKVLRHVAKRRQTDGRQTAEKRRDNKGCR